MSIFRSASSFVQTTFNTATKSVETVSSTLDLGNHWVAENTKATKANMTKSAMLRYSAFNADLRKQLQADAQLAEEYELAEAEWDKL
jgi:hypothetical protein